MFLDILSKPGCRLFQAQGGRLSPPKGHFPGGKGLELSPARRRRPDGATSARAMESRERVCKLILATDMRLHNSLLRDFEALDEAELRRPASRGIKEVEPGPD